MTTKDKIREITLRYRHLLPDNCRYDNYLFAESIKNAYLLSNPIVRKDFDTIRNEVDLVWESVDRKLKIIKI